MSFCKSVVEDPAVIREIIERYCNSLMTQEEIAMATSHRHANVHEIIKRNLTEKDRKYQKSRRYRESKLGDKNPAKGKRPGNYIGECADGHGYITKVVNKKRYFLHRIIFAKMLGISILELPSALHVHHIDGDKTNNSTSNLALATSQGHRAIHRYSPPVANKKKLPSNSKSLKFALSQIRERTEKT